MASSAAWVSLAGLFLVLSSVNGALIFLDANFSSPINLTWANVNFVDQKVIRIPTGTGTRWQLNITANTTNSFTISLSKAYPFASIFGEFVAGWLFMTHNTLQTLDLYDDPASPSDHFLMFDYFKGRAQLNISIARSDFAYAPTFNSDFRVSNISLIASSPDVPQKVDLFRRVALSPGLNEMMHHTITPTPRVFPLSRARGYGWDQEIRGHFEIPGIETRHFFYEFLNAGSHNYSITSSVAPVPNSIEIGERAVYNLKEFRHRNFFLRMHPLTGILVGNHSVTISLSNATSDDALLIRIADFPWLYWDNSAFRLTGAQRIATIPIHSCKIDSNRITYVTVSFIPSSFNAAELESNPREISFSILLNSNVVEPPVLLPNKNVFVPAGRTAIYRLGGFAAASDSTGQIVINKNNSVSSEFGPTGWFTVNQAAGCSPGLISSENMVHKIAACAFAPGGEYDASIRITGPTSFNYTIKSAPMVTQAPVSLPSFDPFLFVGPSDPALYPLTLVLRYDQPFSYRRHTLHAYSNYYKARSCDASSRPVCRITGGDPKRDCDIVLFCPGQSIRLVIDASPVQSYITSMTSITKYPVILNGEVAPSSNQYTIGARSSAALQVTVAPGLKYRVTILSITGGIRSDVPEYYAGGCDGSAPVIGERIEINSTAVRISIEKSGTLILRASEFQVTYSVVFTAAPSAPVQCVNASSLNIPSICANRVSGMVFQPAYISSQIIDVVVPQNSTFAQIFPADFANSSACYNAFMTEACRSYIPLCDSQGKREVGTLCPDVCSARMRAAGCNNTKIISLCSFQRISCPSSRPAPPAVAAAPYIPFAGVPIAPSPVWSLNSPLVQSNASSSPVGARAPTASQSPVPASVSEAPVPTAGIFNVSENLGTPRSAPSPSAVISGSVSIVAFEWISRSVLAAAALALIL